LINITIPENVRSIEDSAFSYCSKLSSLAIPEEVTSIGTNAFSFCSSFVSVIIPESVTSIKTGAFLNCSKLKSVFYQGSQQISTPNVFKGCDALENICVSPDYNFSLFCSKEVSHSSLCQEFQSKFNNCFKGHYNDASGTIEEEKRKNATDWEDRSNGCVEYSCNNDTGKLWWSLCNDSDGLNHMCLEGQCEDKSLNEHNGWAVEIDVEPTEWCFVNMTDIIDQMGLEEGEVTIGFETDEKGNVIRLIIFCDDIEKANLIVAAVNSIDQGDECENILCRRKDVRVKEVNAWIILSVGCLLRNDILLILLLLIIALLMN